MDILDFLPATINTTPSKKITGRKRLQKIIHLLELAGADVEGKFDLLHYGPFSKNVSTALEELEFQGLVKETVQASGVYDTIQYVYEIGDLFDVDSKVPELPDDTDRKLLAKIEEYSTIDLEVASTIGFFETQKPDREYAKGKTKEIKPNKMIPAVIKNAEEILSLIYETKNSRDRQAQKV